MSEENPSNLTDQAEFDRLMTAAQVFRRRGSYAQAEQQVHLALELRPTDIDARELAADLQYARGNWQEAGEAYKAILEEDPSRSSAEEKYAKVVLQTAEADRQKLLMQDMLDHPETHRMPERSPVVAAVLSGIPGLGHVYCGQYIKAAILAACTVISWIIFFALRPSVSSLLPDQRAARFAQDMDPVAIVFLLVAVLAHLYAIVNAAVTADKMNSKKEGTL